MKKNEVSLSGLTRQSLAVILFLLFSVPSLFAAPQYKPLDLSDKTGVEKAISDYVMEREGGLASVAVAVFDKGETVSEQYFGYADIDTDLRANEETVYEWGSTSKLFVWLSAMQLWEQGKLDLDRDIREYLPADFVHKLKYKKPVTMTHLMNHQAGFQECLYENAHAQEKDIHPIDETLLAMQTLQVYEPGTVTAYSNWGTTLAAYVIQCISGEDYADYVHHHILEPLGMNHTAVSATHKDNQWAKNKREELQCYEINSEGREDLGTRVAYVELYPAGAAISTLGDYLIFAKALAGGKDSNSLFKSPETLNVFRSATSFYADSSFVKNCHGMWAMYYGKQLLGHAGNTHGCSANLLFDSETSSGIVIMVNECGESAFNYGLAELVFGSAVNEVDLNKEDVSPDISGFYLCSRDFEKGFLKIAQYTYFMPIFHSKNSEDANSFTLPGGGTVSYLGNKRYLMDNGNGMTVMMYLRYNEKGRPVLEMETMDYIRDPFFIPTVGVIILMILLAVACVVVLIVKGIKYVRSKRSLSLACPELVEGKGARQSILSTIQLLLPAIICIILYFLILSDSARIIKPFAVLSAVLAGLVCLFSSSNGVYLIMKKRWFSAAVGFYCSFFIIFFQFCNFWSI